MIGLLFLFGIVCLFCSCFIRDDRIQQHYNEQQREKQRIAAINAYHDELQRQLAISETKLKLQEMETKIKKLTTDT
jgi:ATP-dependent Lon protease